MKRRCGWCHPWRCRTGLRRPGAELRGPAQIVTCHPASVALKGKKSAKDRLDAFWVGIGAI
jgi:hypothetical protein